MQLKCRPHTVLGQLELYESTTTTNNLCTRAQQDNMSPAVTSGFSLSDLCTMAMPTGQEVTYTYTIEEKYRNQFDSKKIKKSPRMVTDTVVPHSYSHARSPAPIGKMIAWGPSPTTFVLVSGRYQAQTCKT